MCRLSGRAVGTRPGGHCHREFLQKELAVMVTSPVVLIAHAVTLHRGCRVVGIPTAKGGSQEETASGFARAERVFSAAPVPLHQFESPSFKAPCIRRDLDALPLLEQLVAV